MDKFKIPDSSSIVRNRVKDKEIEEKLESGSGDSVIGLELSKESKDSALITTTGDATKVDKSQQQAKVKNEKKSTPEAIFAALTYEEPLNSSPADLRYKLEVLKNGLIVETIEFKERSSYVIGRIPGCDVAAEHPTISRIHAILQFVGEKVPVAEETSESSKAGDNLEKGLYIYDLNSTHGTFLNKNRIYPNRFYRLHVGHVLKFGNSSRLYIVVGPPDDEEEENSKTVTELLQERLNKELERKKLEAERSSISSTIVNDVESEGIDWGMGEDADEESDLRENPFAMDFDSSELNLDNPKKTLRGWFEKEGCELVYDVREKANGQFICTINLPIDGPNDRPVFAEVDVKGKKKDAVAQCALQACQIIDKYGLLRQSHRETRSKRKVKNVEDEDFYSSDEDTFLDRTGSAEKKREKRMKLAGKVKVQSENYESLTSQNEGIQKQIDKLKEKISSAERKSKEAEDLDPLDEYMMDLKAGVSDIKKLKSQLKELVTEQNRILKLISLAKPSALPASLSLPLPLREPITPKPKKEAADNDENNASTSSANKIDTIEVIKSTVDKDKDKIEIKISNPTVCKLYGPKPQLKPLSKPVVLEAPAEATEAISPVPSSVNVEQDSDDDVKQDIDDAKSIKGRIQGDEEDSKPDLAVASKKKRNRQYKKEKGKEVYNSRDPDYSTWLPPEGQSGDGRTSLNEKLGY